MVLGGLEDEIMEGTEEGGSVVFKTTVAVLVLVIPGIDKDDAVEVVKMGAGAYLAVLYLFFEDCCTVDCRFLESSTIIFVVEVIEASLSLSLLLCLIYLLGHRGSSVSTMA